MRVIKLTLALVALSLFLAGEGFTQSDQAISVKEAVERSLPLLQRIGVPFIEHTGCASCHNNALPAMSVSLARERGFKVDEAAIRKSAEATHNVYEPKRESLLQGFGVPGDEDTVSYILVGLAAGDQPADKTTDAMVHFLLAKQRSDGRWRIIIRRPPLETDDFTVTALSLRAIQLYTPRGRADEAKRSVERARAWLVSATPNHTEERAYHLLGLRWAEASKGEIARAAKELLARQRTDGGWSQLPTLESDAYATGQALVALNQAGGVSVTHPAYQRGIGFLLKTQKQDGSWFIQSRSFPFQKQFNSGFPYEKHQWISAAGTSWATMALTLAASPQGRATKSRPSRWN
jgi:hypothetical protein